MSCTSAPGWSAYFVDADYRAGKSSPLEKPLACWVHNPSGRISGMVVDANTGQLIDAGGHPDFIRYDLSSKSKAEVDLASPPDAVNGFSAGAARPVIVAWDPGADIVEPKSVPASRSDLDAALVPIVSALKEIAEFLGDYRHQMEYPIRREVLKLSRSFSVPHAPQECRSAKERLTDLTGRFPWLVTGDFRCIHHSDEPGAGHVDPSGERTVLARDVTLSFGPSIRHMNCACHTTSYPKE